MSEIDYSLRALVVEEAYALRRYATAAELERLDFTKLSPADQDRCIYGQMTGNCHSTRAKQLIGLCAVPFTDYSMIENSLLQSPTGKGGRHWTAIEHYITHKDADIKTLILFLKHTYFLIELVPEHL